MQIGVVLNHTLTKLVFLFSQDYRVKTLRWSKRERYNLYIYEILIKFSNVGMVTSDVSNTFLSIQPISNI